MATRKKAGDTGRENVAAALDQLDSSSTVVNKATAVVRGRLEQLHEMVADLEARIQDMEREHGSEIQELKDKYLKDTTELNTRLQVAEEKLRKVQLTLS